MLIRITSIDISMNNLGIAKAVFNTDDNTLEIKECHIIRPKVPESKSVRQNSKDMERAEQLFLALQEHCKDAHIVCAEVPHGSRSARAMASYGMCCGVLGAIRTTTPVFIEISANEVKSIVGKRDATKKEVIEWVQRMHPSAPLANIRGQIILAQAEHQADAIVAIHAAMQTPIFKSMLTLKESA